MLKSVKVKGLHGRHDYSIMFNRDLTLFTGQNGSGKTSFLKLIWCMLSHNRGLILRELHFEYASIETDKYILELTPKYQGSVAPYTARYLLTTLPADPDVDAKEFLVLYDDDGYVRDGADRLEELNEAIKPMDEKTLFFPTFRRIEGGFGSGRDRFIPSRYGMRHYRSDIAEALESLSDELSCWRHRFVTSISTNDIAERLVDFKNSIDSKTNDKYLEFSREVQRLCYEDKADTADAMHSIKERLATLENDCAELMKPWNVLSQFSREIFKDRGIRIRNLTIGEAETAIDSSSLSAGEKQMFSFLSYNALLQNAIIFIDEPELSLHVDWQRMLFAKLLQQEGTNQFVATTHSPFIYSRYPDKEVMLDVSRGCSE